MARSRASGSATTTVNRTNRQRVVSSGLHHEPIRVLPGDNDSDDSDMENGDESHQNLFTNKATMMANFEEWIKMATDNKINSKNSWNFALIDYFHDLNVLKDQKDGGINFQKASATLDGCMKIYSSRVDSVASETGKLLSGLANDKNNSKTSNKNNGENVADGENEVIIDEATGLPVNNGALDGEEQRRTRTVNRVLETTLTEFENIKLKQLDEELAIDPLFKKALSEFDEAGAKSLLLNTLHVEENGRVVFDAMGTSDETQNNVPADDVNKSKLESDEEDISDAEGDISMDKTNNSILTSNTNMSMDADLLSKMDDDILMLGNSIMANIGSKLLCPSMSYIKESLQDTSKTKNLLESATQDNNNINQNTVGDAFLTEQEKLDIVDDGVLENLSFANMDIDDDGVDDGGLAQDIDNLENISNAQVLTGDLEDLNDRHDTLLTMDKEIGKENIPVLLNMELLSQFDQNMSKSWRGREHWKVQNLKKTLKKPTSLLAINNENNTVGNQSDQTNINSDSNETQVQSTASSSSSKSNTIDFFTFEENFEDLIFDVNNSNGGRKPKIDLPLNNRKSTNLNLLPNDFHFTTDKITRLFIKPDARMGIFMKATNNNNNTKDLINTPYLGSMDETSKNGFTQDTNEPPQLADEKFWAENYDALAKAEDDNNNNNLNDISLNMGMDGDQDLVGEEMGFDFNYAFEDTDGQKNQASTGTLLDPLELLANDDLEIKSLNIDKTNILKSSIKDVTYSRVSKRVDVKKLKDNIWRCIQSVLMHTTSSELGTEEKTDGDFEIETKEVLFTNVIKNLAPLYRPETFADISTSFCFICTLHLANEHGFRIKKMKEANYTDLSLVFVSTTQAVSTEV